QDAFNPVRVRKGTEPGIPGKGEGSSMNKLIPRLARPAGPWRRWPAWPPWRRQAWLRRHRRALLRRIRSPLAGARHQEQHHGHLQLHGAEQTFTVPSGVTSIVVIAIGAAGGSGSTPTSGGTGGTGGEGEQVSDTLAVIPGNTLYVEVGGVGTDGTTTAGAGAGLQGEHEDHRRGRA